MPVTAVRPRPGRGAGLPVAGHVLAVVLAALVVAGAVGLLALAGLSPTAGAVTPERAAAARTAILLGLLVGGGITLFAYALRGRRAGRATAASSSTAAAPAGPDPSRAWPCDPAAVSALAGQARLLALNAAIAAARAGGLDEVVSAVAEEARELAQQVAEVARDLEVGQLDGSVPFRPLASAGRTAKA